MTSAWTLALNTLRHDEVAKVYAGLAALCRYGDAAVTVLSKGERWSLAHADTSVFSMTLQDGKTE